MVAFLLLSRHQLRIDPIRSSSRPLPSEVPDPIVTIETSKMTPRCYTRPGGWIEVDHVSIVGSSVCCRKPCLHNCGIGDAVLHHKVRKYIADRIVWS